MKSIGIGWHLGIVVLAIAATRPAGGQAIVSGLGDAGWRADDSRNASGVDLVGAQFTHHGRPDRTPTEADDTALAQRLNFLGMPSSPNGLGALAFVLDALPGKASKSTISLVNETGFAAASSLAGGDFHATYVWAESAAQSWNNLVFRFGLQSSHWGSTAGGSQAGFTPTRTGESVWDIILVYVPPTGIAGEWNTTEITADTTGWKIYFQAGNTFWQTNYGLTSAGGALGAAHSLNYWLDFDYDPESPGVQSFLDDAAITSIQFGLGSSTGRQGEAYLASFSTSLLPDSYVFAAVPEPGTAAWVAGALAIALAWGRRRLFQRHTG